ncbi:MAG: exodeoxyribonuclease VII large subunit [Candidatus Omnitrophica bacterium]|nr:exodeoxyribonuclease VII large subunit [Candidatus Omnitrophota bacterium]MBU4473006.1 exodeoxyribonuclease VII large subunit [Candidatus Omnitrophota bacterium]MCG2706822.1 exodeoxyribonuclease VII large subunit [Candidatus Omnitrophota bacterium]
MPKQINDLFNTQTSMRKQPRHIYTVSELTQDIKLVLENTLGEVWVEGEVSNFRPAASGHFYFTLKDEAAVLTAVMFSRANKGIKFKIENGLKLICFGSITVYGPRGQYQIIVEKMEPEGIGARQLAFEQLKNRLFKEGLFDPAAKKPLPLMPFRVGVVTSSSSAAIRDILQILKKGASCADVVIRPVRVQGESAAQEIALGVNEFNQFQQVDVIIVSRGGGSTEDLWSFNEEVVARAIYNSGIPTISAVGHQINVTLSDLVADVFVETPSAAAKIIVDKKNALLADLDSHRQNLASSFSEIIYYLHNQLITLRHMLKSPLDRLIEKEQFIDELATVLHSNVRHYLNITQEQTRALIEKLEALSPLAILSRGYSLSLLMPEQAIIKDVAKLKTGDLVKTFLGKGAFLSAVQEVIKDERKAEF